MANETIPTVNDVNFSEKNIEKLKSLYKELGIVGCSFLRDLKSEESFEKGVEHALKMLTHYKEYSDKNLLGDTQDTDKFKLVVTTTKF